MADHHTHNFFMWYPRFDPCINAHLRQKNLIFWAARRYIRPLGQFFLVRAPTQFSWSRPFLPEPFNAPCPYKFVNFLWLIGNLSISIATMAYFHSYFLCKLLNIHLYCKMADS